MKRYILGGALAIAAIAALVACAEKASFDSLETNRGVANDNAVFNAQRWRTQLPQYTEMKILARGDSTQAANCPQGDGWASIDLVSPDGRQKVKLKCSTVSANVGCMLEEDFVKRAAYAQQENHCDENLPKQLKKLAQ